LVDIRRIPAPRPAPRTAPIPIIPQTPIISKLGGLTDGFPTQLTIGWTSNNAANTVGSAEVIISPSAPIRTILLPIRENSLTGSNGSICYNIPANPSNGPLEKIYRITVTTTSSTGNKSAPAIYEFKQKRQKSKGGKRTRKNKSKK
jgi:hypothetical protein